jgi:hypothetical protein
MDYFPLIKDQQSASSVMMAPIPTIHAAKMSDTAIRKSITERLPNVYRKLND